MKGELFKYFVAPGFILCFILYALESCLLKGADNWILEAFIKSAITIIIGAFFFWIYDKIKHRTK